MSDVAAPLSASEQRTMLDASRVWWLFLITGTAWLLFSIIVFRFDYTTVSAIAIVFGILMLGFSLMELVSLMTTSGWSRLLHGVLALAFVVIGIVSFIHPGDTFKALAAVMSFYFIIKGTFDLDPRVRDPAGERPLVAGADRGRRSRSSSASGRGRLRAQGDPARRVGRRGGLDPRDL